MMSETALIFFIISFGLIIIIDIVFIVFCCIMSGRCERWEEEYERTRKIHKQRKPKDLS